MNIKRGNPLSKKAFIILTKYKGIENEKKASKTFFGGREKVSFLKKKAYMKKISERPIIFEMYKNINDEKINMKITLLDD